MIIPGHGPAWHDKDFLNLEADLLESVVLQVTRAVQQGMVTVEEGWGGCGGVFMDVGFGLEVSRFLPILTELLNS